MKNEISHMTDAVVNKRYSQQNSINQQVITNTNNIEQMFEKSVS